ncbi:MAG: lipopolysaccharide biosynthesis protein [Candidatus Kapabacteria bacterium]|nr:lipopolysaccharide biosynthesis protein [Candidatus Kapabacteria bacterium]
MYKKANIKNKAISGFFWSLAENGGSYLLHFLIGLVLVRLIPPYDYGIIGMMTIFFVLGNVLSDSGLTAAIVQKQEPEDRDFSTVLIINVMISFVYYIVLFIVSPFIAEFYREPILTDTLRLFGLNSFIAGFGIVQQAIISRNLDYRRWAKINLTSLFIAGTISIIIAAMGMGLLALVMIQLIQNTANTIQLWIFGGWNHGFRFSMSSFKSLYKFSNPLLVINAVNAIFLEIYYLLIGRIFKAEKLAYYMRARQTAEVFPQQLTYTLNKVMLPVFSNFQDDIESLRSSLRKVYLMVAYLNFNILAFLSINGKAIFILLFTDKWLESVPLFAVLCIEGMFMPAFTSVGNILIARGKSKFYMKIELSKKIVQAISIYLTISSLELLVIGQLIISILFMVIGMIIAKREINFRIHEQIALVLPYVLTAVSIFMINYISNIFLMHSHPAVNLFANLILSFTVFIAISHLFKLEAYIVIRSIIMDKFNLRKR